MQLRDESEDLQIIPPTDRLWIQSHDWKKEERRDSKIFPRPNVSEIILVY